MGELTLSWDYGTFDSFSYKTKETKLELGWDTPDGLEQKYLKAFDTAVIAGLKKVEKDLSGGASEAKKWLAEADKKVSRITNDFDKDPMSVSKSDAKYLESIKDILPDMVENLEKQGVKIFESMLDTIVSNVVDDMVKKFAQKIRSDKIKKWAKFAAFAALVLAASAAAIVVSVLTFGAAIGPIAAVVAAAAGGASSLLQLGLKAKSIWNEGKNDVKNLNKAAKTYSDAAAEFSAMLDRQGSQIAIKRAQLKLLEKQIDSVSDDLKKFEKLASSISWNSKVEKQMAAAESSAKALQSDYDLAEANLAEQEKLLKNVQDHKTFEAATAYAAAVSNSSDLIDKLDSQSGNVNTAVGMIATILSAA